MRLPQPVIMMTGVEGDSRFTTWVSWRPSTDGIPEIGDHGVEALITPGRGEEGIEAGLAAIGQRHLVTFALEDFFDEVADQRFVVDEQDAERRERVQWRREWDRRWCWRIGDGGG
jgi:hypothetical protein